ncbi:GNAT family N-acetyltransferase [Streptomyces litchfieldiae]|uniref:GNAT family N-acetyltransferase n=1 Tax=Streptomyces litchfieldiae TaxID=3075543 RepID=A0ABU2MTZ4_9ACTN|nr:GNAT family N-acetyltransferase [Streptomyces sp. DSM 44938]MDT0345109.1 GNAT family N-acetyltransferase [Streptomyces sp. DSM 44938]
MHVHLITARLRLRRFTGDDAAALATLHGDPQVMRHIDDGRPVACTVVERETLPALLREYDQLPSGFGCFAAEERATDAFVGWFSLRPAASRGLAGGTELGYRLVPAAWGHGYATEGARALIRHGFEGLDVERIVATTMTVNVASRRVMEKAGLRLVRTFFEEWPEYLEGAEHGDVEYALPREEWAAGQYERD